MSKNIKAFGINYSLPQVSLLHATPLGLAEFAGRTCYNSFDKSEHKPIKDLNKVLSNGNDYTLELQEVEQTVNDTGSELLHQLSHVFFHESVLEHISLNFLIKNTSRAVLMELSRHRIASYSVQSTRYTMSDLINWFNITKKLNLGVDFFINKIDELNIFVTDDREYNAIEIDGIWTKLNHQWNVLGGKIFKELSIAKSLLESFEDVIEADEAFTLLSSKAKKNVGDFIKGIIVCDTVSVDLAFTINLRSLQNFLNLRMSGAAYWQMQLLAHSIYKQVPENYLTLVVNDAKRSQFEKLNEKIESGEWA